MNPKYKILDPKAQSLNPFLTVVSKVCMNDGVEMLLARRFGREVLVECVECCKVFAASHRLP